MGRRLEVFRVNSETPSHDDCQPPGTIVMTATYIPSYTLQDLQLTDLSSSPLL